MFANRHIYLTAILLLLSVNTMQSQWYVSSGYVPYYPGDNILFGGNNYYLYGINNALQYMSIGPNGVPANIGNVYAGNFSAITSFSNQIVICEDILGGGTWGHASWATRDVSHIVKGTVTNTPGHNVVTLIVNGYSYTTDTPGIYQNATVASWGISASGGTTNTITFTIPLTTSDGTYSFYMKAKTGSNTGYFDQFSITVVHPLPVELTLFTVSLNGPDAELCWNTATEVNSYGFEIERKAMDSWAKIGFVNGSGTTNAPKDYSFVDKGLNSGKYSYRLKQIDQDGKIEYSKEIEALVVARAKSFALEQNFPNPLNPSTTISYGLPMDCHVRIAIYNSIGQLAAQLINASQAAGWHQVMWNAEVSSGVYLCRIEAISQSNSNIHFVDTKKMVLTR